MRLLLAPFLAASLLLVGCSNATEEPSEPVAAVPDGWKVESYGDVTLRVPESWVPGYSPVVDSSSVGRRAVLQCGSVDGSYVGRPQFGSDLCVGDAAERIQQSGFLQEAVWFESPLELGTLAGEVPAETIRVGPSQVTVAAEDAAVRRRILESARVITDTDPNGCPLAPVAPDPERPAEGPGKVLSVAVCAYDENQRLLWSGTAPPDSGDAMLLALRSAKPSGPKPKRKAYQVVNLIMQADDPEGVRTEELRWLVEPDLTRLAWNGQQVELNPDLIRPWAGDAIKAYLVGGGTGEVYGFFRGLLG